MKVLFTLLGIFVGMSVTQAQAREEITASSAGFGFGGSSTRLSFAPGYNHQFFDWLQAGGFINYQKLSFGDSSVNTWTLGVGPTINIGPVENAIFFSLGFAIRKGSGEIAAGAEDPNGAGPYIMGGRRFFFGRFSYSPHIGIQTAGGTHFFFNLLSLSYFL